MKWIYMFLYKYYLFLVYNDYITNNRLYFFTNGIDIIFGIYELSKISTT